MIFSEESDLIDQHGIQVTEDGAEGAEMTECHVVEEMEEQQEENAIAILPSSPQLTEVEQESLEETEHIIVPTVEESSHLDPVAEESNEEAVMDVDITVPVPLASPKVYIC